MKPAPQGPEGAVQAVSQCPATVEAAPGWSSLPRWLTIRALVIDTGTGREGEVQAWPYYSWTHPPAPGCGRRAAERSGWPRSVGLRPAGAAWSREARQLWQRLEWTTGNVSLRAA